ncbi:hypothetical protein [Nocardioides sp. NPDC006273]|uniref:hypothetical protein n=1 Tax=Nocardioides sp. NPDC006273 TaxID=3155598 RepID=UPI0033B09016
MKLADRARKQSANSDWQRQGWYYYDAIGELRSPLVWIANAVSQADIHATELDPATGTPTGPSENAIAMQAAAQVLGGAAKRATLLKVLALCWQVPGEAWVIVRPRPPIQGRPQPDEWIVLPPSQVKSKGNGADAKWEYRDPKIGVDVQLDSKSRLFRVWSPHPADFIQADSAVRPALPVCREIEKAGQTIAAQLDSRLALAGLLLLADELDLPRGEHDTTALALMDELLAAAEATIQQPGTPSAVVPITINAPADMIASGGAMAFINPITEFVGGLDDLRDRALARLANTLDMPKDIAAGTQGESNHWSAWQVEESTYKIFIEPLLQALGDALTEQWFRPALVAMGMTEEQAATYEVGWDTTKIVARPDDTENLRDLHDRLLISDEYMLAENGIPVDAAPDQEEYTRRLLEKIVIGAPSLLSDPNVAAAMGLEVVVAPEATGASGEIEGGQLEPAESSRALPSTQGTEPEPEAVPDGLTAAAELLVFDALSRAGGRLLTRENRGQFANVPKHELHTKLESSGDDGRLLEGSFQFVGPVAEAFGLYEGTLRAVLKTYVRNRLYTREPHNRTVLTNMLTEAMR